ncbi:MAG: hypothetical protein AB7I41_04920 [Candidatus Sericytochromatia bacterium]
MDLQTLQTYQQKSEHSSRARHETAADLLRCGWECLADAQAEGFADRALLAEACEYLMEALRLNHRECGAFIGMGYLLWLLGDNAVALTYLQVALELEPENQDAQTLLLLVDPPQIAAAPSPDLPPVRVSDLPNYDQLYDELQALIIREIQLVSALPPQTFLVSNQKFKIEQMERKYRQWVETQANLQHKMGLVEVEIDCSELQKMLRPLYILLQRAQTQLNLSWQWVHLEETLMAQTQWLDAQIVSFEVQNGALPLSFSLERFDVLLEDCDSLADLLDEYELKQLDVSSLIAKYEAMTDKISQIQDYLDQI